MQENSQKYVEKQLMIFTHIKIGKRNNSLNRKSKRVGKFSYKVEIERNNIKLTINNR